MLAKRLALIVSSLVRKAQTSVIPNRSILYLMRYIIEKAGTKAGVGGALINLDQPKAFDWVEHRYLAAVLKTTGFRPVSRGWIAAMHSYTGLVVKISAPFSITR